VSCAVLIVGFRAYDALERCLASLPGYLQTDDEVVVVDHESDARALSKALARCPAARGIPRPDNPGFAAGVNRAARETRAPYLLCLNPDAELVGPVPRVLEAWLATHADTAVVGPRVVDPDGRVQGSARRFPRWSAALAGRSSWLTRRYPDNWLTSQNVVGQRAVEPMDVDWVAGSCLMTRRDVFNQLGGFDEGFFLYWEDADYCRRAAKAGFRATYLPQVTVRHQAGASSGLAKAASVRAFHESAYRLFVKHAGVSGRIAAPVVKLGLRTRSWWRLKGLERDA